MIYQCLFKTTFSFSKNYTSLFKIRTRLSSFFKHVHPDQMNQAPTKVKEQNLRSLKNLNSYFDALNSASAIQGKLLKFYIAQKTNNKSKKFFSFNLQLPELGKQQQLKMNEQKAGKLLQDIVTALNNKFKESRDVNEKKKDHQDKPISFKDQINFETEEERISRLTETIGPFERRASQKQSMEEQTLKNHINAKFMESEKEDLKLKLRKNMSFADTSTNKPMMWSRIIMEESGLYKDYQAILDQLIDPKLIYFQESLTIAEIEQFKKNLLPGQQDRSKVRQTHNVLKVCEQMQGVSPPICFYVTRHYSSKDIPGFFSVPFDFKPLEIYRQFQLHRKSILEERNKFQQLYDYYRELETSLNKNNNIIMKLPQLTTTAAISSHILMMQRLSKYKSKNDTKIEVVVFDEQQMDIYCEHYKEEKGKTVYERKGKIFAKEYFLDHEISLFLVNQKGIQVETQSAK